MNWLQKVSQVEYLPIDDLDEHNLAGHESNWCQKIIHLSAIEIMPRKYLFDIGMSGTNIKGEIVELQEPVSTTRPAVPVPDFNLPAGMLAVLLDEGTHFIVAIPMGMFGFQPFRSDPGHWRKTGQPFDGDYKKFQYLSEQSQGQIDPQELQGIIQAVQSDPQCTAVFESEHGVRFIFYTEPQGPEGYRSPYQILLDTRRQPGLISITTVVEGTTNQLAVGLDGLENAVIAAKQFLDQKGIE